MASHKVGNRGKNKGKNAVSNENSEDLAELRKPILTNVSGFGQACKIFDLATEELKALLSEECDVLYECKACRSLFRSLANFVSHKRAFCREKFNASVHGHFIKPTSTLNELMKITRIEEGYQEYLKETRDQNTSTDDYDERVPLTKDLTTIVEKLTKMRGVSSASIENQPVTLQKIPSTTVAVFQNVGTETDGPDNMRNQVNELESMLSRNVGVLQSDGNFEIQSENNDDTENVIQISDDEDCDVTELKCLKCHMRFSTTKTLKFHMKYKHVDSRRVYPCPDCMETFSTSWSVYRHLFKVHRKTLPQIRRMRESIQSKAFLMNNPPAFYEKRKNMKTTAPPKITEEERIDQENQAWMNNMEWSGGVPRCGGCGRTFERRAALAAHANTCAPRERALRRPDKRIEIQIRRDYDKGPPAGPAGPAAQPPPVSATAPPPAEATAQSVVAPPVEPPLPVAAVHSATPAQPVVAASAVAAAPPAAPAPPVEPAPALAPVPSVVAALPAVTAPPVEPVPPVVTARPVVVAARATPAADASPAVATPPVDSPPPVAAVPSLVATPSAITVPSAVPAPPAAPTASTTATASSLSTVQSVAPPAPVPPPVPVISLVEHKKITANVLPATKLQKESEKPPENDTIIIEDNSDPVALQRSNNLTSTDTDSTNKTNSSKAESVREGETVTAKFNRLPYSQHAEKSNLMALRQRIIGDIVLEQLMCKKCGAKHNHIQDLYDHVASHYKWVRYACKLCNFKHYYFDKLPEHVKVVHKMKGDKDFYFSTVKALNGAEAVQFSEPAEEEPSEIIIANSPDSSRPSRCSSDSSRLSDDSSSSNTKETANRKRKVVPTKVLGKRRREWRGNDTDKDEIKSIEENSSDMDDERKQAADSVASRRPVRRRTRPINADFEYDLSNLLKMEAQGYRDSQTSSTNKTNQQKKKSQTDHQTNYELLNKECCGALLEMSRKAVAMAKAHMKTPCTAVFPQRKARLSSVFVRPKMPKLFSRSDKASPKKDIMEDHGEKPGNSSNISNSDNSLRRQTKSKPLSEETIEICDIAPSTSISENGTITIDDSNDALDSESNNKNAPPVLPITFRRQSLEVIKNPIINKNIKDFNKTGMKTKILVIKPISRNKDGMHAVNTPLKFQTIKLKDTTVSSTGEEKTSDQVVVVKMPTVDRTVARAISETAATLSANNEKSLSVCNETKSLVTNKDDVRTTKNNDVPCIDSVEILDDDVLDETEDGTDHLEFSAESMEIIDEEELLAEPINTIDEEIQSTSTINSV